MAKPKKDKGPKVMDGRDYVLKGGPRNGDKLRLTCYVKDGRPFIPFIRLAFPEWCNYEYDLSERSFVYAGSEPPQSGGWGDRRRESDTVD